MSSGLWTRLAKELAGKWCYSVHLAAKIGLLSIAASVEAILSPWKAPTEQLVVTGMGVMWGGHSTAPSCLLQVV